MRVSVLALCGAILASPVSALTADQVWAGWQDAARAVGFDLSAAETRRSGGTLTLRDLRFYLPDAGPVGALTLPALALTDVGDGKVQVTPTGELRLRAPDGMAVDLVISQQDFVLTLEESDGALVYHATAESLGFAAVTMEERDPDPESPDTTVTMELKALDLQVSDTPGEGRIFGIDLTSALLTTDYAETDLVSGVETRSTVEVDDLVLFGDVVLARNLSLLDWSSAGDLAALLKDGLSLRLESRYGEQRATERAVGGDLRFNVAYTVLPGSTDIVLDGRTLSFTTAAKGLDGVVRFGDPVEQEARFAMGPLDVLMAAPGPAITGVGDWAVRLNLADVTLDEAGWTWLDPERILDRASIAASIDLGWRMQGDLLAASAAKAKGEIAPRPVPESTTLHDFTLSGLGFAAKAAGDFAFKAPDGAATEPVPIGSGTLEVTGLNRMINALVELGVMSRDEAVPLRLSMAAFLKPAGEDRFTSQVEALPDGKVYVNGARLR